MLEIGHHVRLNCQRLQCLPSYGEGIHWDGRWELLDGIAYAMTHAPSIDHQRVSQKIARLLDEALEDCDECVGVNGKILI